MRPPILLVHGAFGQAAHFEPWRGYLQEAGYEVTAVSLPGRSPPDPEALKHLTFADCVAAVAEAAAGLGRPPVVVGHSMGGLVAMKLAAETECAGLVVVAAPAPCRLPARLGVFGHALPFVPRILAGLPVNAPPQAVRALVTHDLSAAESDEIIAQSVTESGRVLRRMALGATRVAYGAIRCPVLCLGAGDDRLVPHSAAHRIARATGAELVVFARHGHWLIAGSLTGIVAATVRDWLDRRF